MVSGTAYLEEEIMMQSMSSLKRMYSFYARQIMVITDKAEFLKNALSQTWIREVQSRWNYC